MDLKNLTTVACKVYMYIDVAPGHFPSFCHSTNTFQLPFILSATDAHVQQKFRYTQVFWLNNFSELCPLNLEKFKQFLISAFYLNHDTSSLRLKNEIGRIMPLGVHTSYTDIWIENWDILVDENICR